MKLIVTYCKPNRIINEINMMWVLLELPVNDNLENGLKILDQIKEIRRRMLL